MRPSITRDDSAYRTGMDTEFGRERRCGFAHACAVIDHLRLHFGQSCHRAACTVGRSTSILRVGAVLTLRAWKPVRRVMTEREVTGMSHHLLCCERPDEADVGPSHSPCHPGAATRQVLTGPEAAVAIGVCTASPRPAVGRAVALNFGPIPLLDGGRRPAGHRVTLPFQVVC